MTIGVITGCGLLSAAGEDLRALAEPVGAVHGDVSARLPGLPKTTAPVIADFDVRARLGRKGTSSYDRATALAVVACDAALRDAGLDLETADRSRIGLVLGTTTGSLGSTMDYSRETLVQDRPYLVNPMLFPNTVMNCAAGQAAIRFGLRGVNATVAGGPIGFLQALRYAMAALDRGHADTVLVGAVEEFTPHTAWGSRILDDRDAGEAATVFVLRRDAVPDGPSAEVLATAAGFCPDFSSGDALVLAVAACVRRAIAAAGIDPLQVAVMVTGEGSEEPDAIAAALGHRPRRLEVPAELGDCRSAGGGLALATVLAQQWYGQEPDGEVAVLTGHSRDGGVLAAVVRGWRDAGRHRR